MQNEDDLRGLAKIMELMRAISIILCVVHVYWFCNETIREWGVDVGVVDKILLNFNRTTGLFSSILWTKIFAVVFLALSCWGTKGVKEEKIRWRNIYICLGFGFILFFLNVWLLCLRIGIYDYTEDIRLNELNHIPGKANTKGIESNNCRLRYRSGGHTEKPAVFQGNYSNVSKRLIWHFFILTTVLFKEHTLYDTTKSLYLYPHVMALSRCYRQSLRPSLSAER